MRFAVVDDEITHLNLISQILKKMLDDNKCVIDCYQDAVAFLEHYQSISYDALFLDIDMPEIDGFELSKQLIESNNDVPIIYITGRDELIIQSFRYRPIGFVRKHNMESELKFALSTLLQHITQTKVVIQVTELRSYGGKEYKIPIEQISYIESENHNTHIHLINENLVVVRKPLSFYTKNEKFKNFLLINSGVLVNVRHIQMKDDKVILNDNTVLFISRRKIQAVREAYLQSKRRLLI